MNVTTHSMNKKLEDIIDSVLQLPNYYNEIMHMFLNPKQFQIYAMTDHESPEFEAFCEKFEEKQRTIEPRFGIWTFPIDAYESFQQIYGMNIYSRKNEGYYKKKLMPEEMPIIKSEMNKIKQVYPEIRGYNFIDEDDWTFIQVFYNKENSNLNQEFFEKLTDKLMKKYERDICIIHS